ncbi:hypothetical protein D3C71_1931120 [compost metagenome]
MDVAGQRYHVADALRFQERHHALAFSVVAVPLIRIENVLIEQRHGRQLGVQRRGNRSIEHGVRDAGVGQQQRLQ